MVNFLNKFFQDQYKVQKYGLMFVTILCATVSLLCLAADTIITIYESKEDMTQLKEDSMSDGMIAGALILWIPGIAFNILQTLNTRAEKSHELTEVIARRETEQSKSGSKNHSSGRALGTITEIESDPGNFGDRSSSLKNPNFSSSTPKSRFLNPHGSVD